MIKRLFFNRFSIYALLFFFNDGKYLQAQDIQAKLENAYKIFESDEQLRHAIHSFYVIDTKTGEVLFDRNSQVGLAPASTQKIITSVTAFELLGKDFRYKTDLSYKGDLKKNVLDGDLY